MRTQFLEKIEISSDVTNNNNTTNTRTMHYDILSKYSRINERKKKRKLKNNIDDDDEMKNK